MCLLSLKICSLLMCRWQEANSDARLTFVHNPSSTSKQRSEPSPLSLLISHLHVKGLLGRIAPSQLLRVLLGSEASFTDATGTQQVISFEQSALEALTDVKFADISAEEHALYSANTGRFSSLIGLSPGQQALLANGRVGRSSRVSVTIF
jgi:hypothetical protein